MILVTGATGLNGSELVHRLSARGVPVRALVRSAAKAERFSALPNVEIVEGDMAQPETLSAALRGVERAMLISSSDPTMLEVQSNFIKAARKADVKHIVKLSGIIAELDSPFRFARMHGEIERRLEASGIAFTHLRAGEFMHAYFRQVPSIVAKGALFLPMEDARIASIDIGDIAEVAAIVLTGSGHEGQIYPLTGPEALSMAEVAEKLSIATGKPIQYVNVAPEEAKSANLAAGMPPYLVDALFELLPSGGRARRRTFRPSSPRFSGGKRHPSTSLLRGTPPSSAVSNQRQRANFTSRYRKHESYGGSSMNTQERNKDQLQRLYDEVINTGDLDRADRYITPDRPDNDPNLPPEMTRDREGFKLFFRMFRAAFPDQKFSINFMIAEGDKVMAIGLVEGTHQGDFFGMPATRKHFKVRNIDICRFNAEGLIAEHWGLFDRASMMQQLS